jgi:hypothetical protein
VICPLCGAEYVPGFTRCSDCDVPLVENAPEPQAEPKPVAPAPSDVVREAVELVSVFRSNDPGRIAIAKSILASAEVPYVMHNEATQRAFGVSPFFMPAGNMLFGPTEILVRREDAEDARLLVCELEGVSTGVAADEAEVEGEGHS